MEHVLQKTSVGRCVKTPHFQIVTRHCPVGKQPKRKEIVTIGCGLNPVETYMMKVKSNYFHIRLEVRKTSNMFEHTTSEIEGISYIAGVLHWFSGTTLFSPGKLASSTSLDQNFLLT